MKLSVSLPVADVEFLDAFTRGHGLASRSAAVAQAVRALRAESLTSAYEQAFDDGVEEAAAWDVAVADGMSQA
ncbi:MAG TPA: antitoxin [Micrococcales bacterium]|uniref:ribbon-helix-helix domain-containing protein n=1 Tax=Miniimonas arenae TaxID=676201 RepID=UPI000EE20A4F|nr:ribbon-helix-helix domain-containing protein [Miniimonas arenae]HCX85403.1 antitoxin [Micrococcales bacterium]